MIAEIQLLHAGNLVFPVPDLPYEIGHVDLLVFHVQHPGMFEHPPGSRSSRRFFLQTRRKVSTIHLLLGISTRTSTR
jgi:hypothetical protein